MAETDRARANSARFNKDPRRDDVQRRRREVALTASWLRELRGLSAGDASARSGSTR